MADHAAEEQPAPGEPVDLDEAVRARVLQHDCRYTLHAYRFLFESLSYTQQALGIKPAEGGPPRHITGQQLLAGIRDYAQRCFGPLAATVFRSWGVHSTEDFGEIVFNLVDGKLLAKTPEDSRADFANGYSFDDAFGGPLQLS